MFAFQVLLTIETYLVTKCGMFCYMPVWEFVCTLNVYKYHLSTAQANRAFPVNLITYFISANIGFVQSTGNAITYNLPLVVA